MNSTARRFNATRRAPIGKYLYRAAKYAAPKIVRKVSPYIAAAGTAYDVASTLYNKVKSFDSKQRKKNSYKPQPRKQSPRKPKNVKKRFVFNTTGVPQGIVSAPNKKLHYDKRFNLYGSMKINEFGGVLTANSTNAVYINHGIANEEVVIAFWRAIVKECFRQMKNDIKSWDDVSDFTNTASTTQLQFRFKYTRQPSQNANTVTFLDYTPAASLTYAQLAEAMSDYFRDNSGSGAEPRELIQVQLFGLARNSGDTATYYDSLAIIHCKQVLLEFKYVSNLTIMNRTLAEVATVGEGATTRDATTDINNVPLIGKVYSGATSWRNYIDVDMKTNAAGNFAKKLVCDDDTGLMQFESSANGSGVLKKPPPGYILGFKSDKRIIVKPGDIVTNKMVFTCQMSIAKFFVKFQQILGNSSVSTTESCRTEFGHIQGFGLEKMLDTDRSSGSPISLGYQLTQKIGCLIKYKSRTASLPIVNDTSTAISYSTDKPT